MVVQCIYLLLVTLQLNTGKNEACLKGRNVGPWFPVGKTMPALPPREWYVYITYKNGNDWVMVDYSCFTHISALEIQTKKNAQCPQCHFLRWQEGLGNHCTPRKNLQWTAILKFSDFLVSILALPKPMISLLLSMKIFVVGLVSSKIELLALKHDIWGS